MQRVELASLSLSDGYARASPGSATNLVEVEVKVEVKAKVEAVVEVEGEGDSHQSRDCLCLLSFRTWRLKGFTKAHLREQAANCKETGSTGE